MAITYRNVKGSNLTSAEVDTNFSDLDALVTGLPVLSPNDIDDIALETGLGKASQMTVTLVSGAVFGPFRVFARGRELLWFRGLFEPNASYEAFDLITGNRVLYLVTRDFEAGSEFDPLVSDTEGYILRKIWGSSREEDLAVYVGGSIPPDPSAPIFQYPFSRLGILPGTGYAYARGAPATAAEYTLAKNGVSIGTLTISAGSHVGTFAFSSTLFDPGDLLTISQSDDGLPSDLSITLNVLRG